MMRPAVLAVDAGNSKVDAVLLGTAGDVCGAVRLHTSGHGRAGGDGHLRSVADAIARACSAAGIADHNGAVADIGVYCLAGADFFEDDERIARWLGDRGWSRESHLRNDTFAVMRAGAERGWGVAVVCGHGTNCSGVGPDGRTVRFPAVGDISGDWGGGFDIGLAALWHATRAEDGRGEPTELARVVPAFFGMATPSDVTRAIHFDRMSEERLGELPPAIFEAAARGDGIARSIVGRQADEIVVMAGSAIRRLDLTAHEVDVVLGGGIFRTRDEHFYARIRRGLEAICAGARVTVLRRPPVLGAALLGMDLHEGGIAAARRVGLALTDELFEHSVETVARKEESWPGSSSRA